MKSSPIPRLDENELLHEGLLKCCRIHKGEIWEDPAGRHRIGCFDAARASDVQALMGTRRAVLAVQDPPYNIVAFERRDVPQFIAWCRQWVDNTYSVLDENGSLYVWMGADQAQEFQPLPDFMIMMRSTPFKSRSFITMRNQRGYGTQKNWMAVRQELLYYTSGTPSFDVDAEYTEIPKILRGYYKEVGGKRTENVERSGSENIRAGNVWVDIQQVFYRMVENVNGCYAQKPLKSVERIIRASSRKGELVMDFFAHSGSTLLAAEMSGRPCFTMDIDPVYCEICIRRLEHFRRTGLTGWQNGHPFEKDLAERPELAGFVEDTVKIPDAFQTALF